MIPTIFKPREIHKSTHGNSVFHLVACRYFQDSEVGERDWV